MSRVLPILFNTDMVRAILDGQKTVTRRIIMPHNRKEAKEQGYHQGNGLWIDDSSDNPDKTGHIKDYSASPCWMSYNWYIERYAPYQPGDILYVRETWTRFNCCSCEGDYKGECAKNPDKNEGCYAYRATDEIWGEIKWRPSIHMPKEAARIWLKVTNVRVERLQDITEEQAQMEGCNSGLLTGPCTARGQFENLWNPTIKKSDLDRYGWDANPWVWVIEFEQCEKPDARSE